MQSYKFDQNFRYWWSAHKIYWDKVSSLIDPLGHLYHDAPHWFVLLVGVVASGLGVGAYYGYKKYKKSQNNYL